MLLKAYLASGNLKGVCIGFRNWMARNLRIPIAQVPLPRLAGSLPGSSLAPAANPLAVPIDYDPALLPAERLKDRKKWMARVFKRIEPLKAKVSVIVPCYNYGKYVKEAVDSVLAQSYRDLEVIVVNDGSTDPHTLKVLPKLDQPSRQVRVLNQKNQGLSMARNNGAANAKGDFLVFLDADDTLDEDALALMLYQFVLDPAAAAVFPQQHFFGDQELVWACQEFNAYDLLWAAHVTVCLMIRRDIFDKSKKYQPSMKYGYEDWEFSLGLAGKGWRPRLIPLPLFNHRRHGRTMTAEAHDKKTHLYNELIRLNSELYTMERLGQIKKESRPFVSIVIPYYNSPKFIDETLASIKRQTIDDYEAILIDDGSDDPDAVAKLNEIEAEGFARVIRLPHRGTAAARNRGALEARGEFLCFLDADDLIDPGYCEKLGLMLSMNPSLAFVYSGVAHFGDMQAVAFDEYDVERLKRENFLAVTCLIRRAVYLKIGGMDEAMIQCHEDYDFWLRLASEGYRGAMVYEAMFHYRRHAQGKMASVTRRMSDEEILALMRGRYPKLFGVPNGTRPEMRLLAPPETQDETIALEASYCRQARIGMGVPYEGHRRANTPSLFNAKYHDPGRINVLYLIPHMVVGGAERVDLDVLSGLDRARFRVILVVELQGNHGWYEIFESLVDELFLCPNFLRNDHQMDNFLDYLLIAKNIDIVFNRNTYVGYRAIQRWAPRHPDVRLVDQLHLHNFGEDWVTESRPKHGLLHRRCVSNQDLARYAANLYGCPESDFRVIHCGADPEIYSPEAVAGGVLRGEMKLPRDKMLVGFIARMEPQKDPLKWLEVAAEINRRDKSVFFAMIGGGPLLEKTMARVGELGLSDYVHFGGYRPDIAPMLADMDCLLMVSNHEGIPQVVYMALSMGVPVVSSDAGGTRECVTEEVGHVLPIDAEPARFADKTLGVLGQIRQGDDALRRRCRQRVLDHFQVKRMQQRYVEEFESLYAEVDRPRRLKNHQARLMEQALW
jgi:glycosyltransferase involved in cell wall biosynthesis